MNASAARQTCEPTRPAREPGQIGRRNSALRRRIFGAKELHSTTAKFLWRIAELCNYGDNPAGCFARLTWIAAEVNVSPRQATRIAKFLADGGWIQIDRQSETGSKFARGTIYLGPTCWVVSLPDAPRHPDEVHLDTQDGAPRHPGPADWPQSPYGDSKTEETTTDEPDLSSSFSSLRFPEGIQTDEAPPAVPSSPETIAKPPAAQDLDVALVAALVVRVVALFGLAAHQAEAKICNAARVFSLAWIAQALDEAERRRPSVREWSWGFVLGILRNFGAEGGPSPRGTPSIDPGLLREYRDIQTGFRSVGWILVPEDPGFKRDPGISEPGKVPPELARRFHDHRPGIVEMLRRDAQARKGCVS